MFNTVKPLRNDLCIGVQRTRSGRFRAKIKEMGVNVYLGTFNSKEDAFAAYKQAKEEKVKRLAEFYKDRIDVRCFEFMMNFTVSMED